MADSIARGGIAFNTENCRRGSDVVNAAVDEPGRHHKDQSAGHLDGRFAPKFISGISVQQEKQFKNLVRMPCYALGFVAPDGADVSDDPQTDILSSYLFHGALKRVFERVQLIIS